MRARLSDRVRVSFFTVCGDGSFVCSLNLDDKGAAQQEANAARLLSMGADPVTEKAVRMGAHLVLRHVRRTHLSRSRRTQRRGRGVRLGGSRPKPSARPGWRPGGLQQLAVERGQFALYAIMHRGGIETHKDPGKDVWVFDMATRQRVQISLKNPAGSILPSSDQHPLMYSIFYRQQRPRHL